MAVKKNQYRDPILNAIIEYLKKNGSPDIKNYYWGDVLMLQKRELPAVSVAIDSTNVTTDSTEDDKSTVPLVINVITEINDNPARDFDLMGGSNQLYDIVIGRKEDYTFKDTAFVKLLRQKVQLDNKQALDGSGNISVFLGYETDRDPLNVDFGIGVERRGQGIWSVEAAIRVNAYVYTPKV